MSEGVGLVALLAAYVAGFLPLAVGTIQTRVLSHRLTATDPAL